MTGIQKENYSHNLAQKEEEEEDIVTMLNPAPKYKLNEVKWVPMDEVEDADDYLNFD